MDINAITITLVFITVWLAATISGTTGFGGALLLLPIFIFLYGAKAAVPILTVIQLVSNLSRAYFGRQEIHSSAFIYFICGSIPSSIVGARIFAEISIETANIFIGSIIILILIIHRFGLIKLNIKPKHLLFAGLVLGFLSALVGSVGPLQAMAFLGLGLPATAYVATEAAAASIIHIIKILVYQRYALIGTTELIIGVTLAGPIILGSWTGRKLIKKLKDKRINIIIEMLLFMSALIILFH